jgi:ribonuclease-3
MLDFVQLEASIGHTFSNRDLLLQVFVHRSYVNENRSLPVGHNERLEFLGDAVLELIVTEYLFGNYPNPEGELTAYRSALVKGETLAVVAQELNFSEYLLVSKGEEKSGGRSKGYLLANTFEAMVGALHLDGGYAAAEQFVHKYVLSRLEDILAQNLHLDPKSKLQEFTQENLGGTPSYEVLGEEGPDHEKTFRVAVRVNGRVLGEGTGQSKQAAQVAAAQAALTALAA